MGFEDMNASFSFWEELTWILFGAVSAITALTTLFKTFALRLCL